jgi:hypothetical protein
MTNKEKNLISSLLFGGLLIAVTVKFYNKDINIDLSQVDKITGIVTSSGVTDKSSTVGGKLKVKGSVFYITLDNSEQNFATHRPSQDYKLLSDKVIIGDTITIFYKARQDNDLNLDVYQIEKKGQVLQDYESYNNNYKKLSWLTGIAGLGLLTFGIWQYFKKAD